MKHKNVIFGVHPVLEAIKSGKSFDKIFLQNGLDREVISRIISACKEVDIACQFVPIQKLNRITGKNHQGVIGFTSPIDFYDIEQVVPGIFEDGHVPLILILDKITDVRNFGAICRTAEFSGVHTVIIPNRESASINEDAIKTSAGALFNIPICRYFSLKKAIEYLKNSGIQIVACTEKTHINYTDVSFTTPTAMILGSEGEGISEVLLNLSDIKCKIPQIGQTNSLNVSVAAGIFIFEAIRQRQNSK